MLLARHIGSVGTDAVFAVFFLVRHGNARGQGQNNYRRGGDYNPNIAVIRAADPLKMQSVQISWGMGFSPEKKEKKFQ